MKPKKTKKEQLKVLALGTVLAVSGGAVQELIINGKDWQPLENVSQEIKTQSLSQFQLRLSTGFRCSGFAASKTMLITNNHCVPVKGVTTKAMNGETETECTKLLHTNKASDYSIMECPGADFTPVEFDANPVAKNDAIYVLHSNCDYYENSFCRVIKLYSVGKILSIGNVSLSHDGDTLGGSSGAPIFRDGKLVGIHNSGSGNDGFGNGTHNGGRTARGMLLNMPSVFRDKMLVTGDSRLPQNNTKPYVPTGSSRTYSAPKRKKSLWYKFKCLFKKSC